MFPYFGIFKPSASEEEIEATGIETPRNVVRQKPFFGSTFRRHDDASLRISRLERDLAVLHGAAADEVPDTTAGQPIRFAALFVPPYV